jgi:hypothetical protein
MNDMHVYDRFLFTLRTVFTRRAQPHLRSLWADLMELEEAPDAHAFRVARDQTLRRLQVLGRAARAVEADEVEALGRTLAELVTTVTDARDAKRQELFDSLHEKMRELVEASYAIQATPSAVGRNRRPAESELVESYAS